MSTEVVVGTSETARGGNGARVELRCPLKKRQRLVEAAEAAFDDRGGSEQVHVVRRGLQADRVLVQRLVVGLVDVAEIEAHRQAAFGTGRPEGDGALGARTTPGDVVGRGA